MIHFFSLLDDWNKSGRFSFVDKTALFQFRGYDILKESFMLVRQDLATCRRLSSLSFERHLDNNFQKQWNETINRLVNMTSYEYVIRMMDTTF